MPPTAASFVRACSSSKAAVGLSRAADGKFVDRAALEGAWPSLTDRKLGRDERVRLLARWL